VSGKDTSLDQLAALVGNIDMVYEATGASSVSFELMNCSGRMGCFFSPVFPGERANRIDADLIMRNLVLKNQVVFGTVNANREAFEPRLPTSSLHEKVARGCAGANHPTYPMELNGTLLGKVGGIKNVISIG